VGPWDREACLPARAFYEAVGFKEYSLELEVPASERGAAQGERTHPQQG